MAPTRVTRDVDSPDEPAVRRGDEGRKYVAVIGIDRYRAWDPLYNAVGDARGVLAAFEKLGFEQAVEPLLDHQATREALHHLANDGLRALGTNDSLVLFFAGHGHTVTTPFADGGSLRKGYIIPVDADSRDGRISTWIRLDSWLSDVARLPAKHILVVLDACHSGIALDQVVIRYRGGALQSGEPIEQLRARRSRRVMTSALDNQRAMDGGPRPGHSLFTGCLIEALEGGLTPTHPGLVTGSDLWNHVRSRVINFPSSKQTPDFGALEHDDRGELVVELPGPAPDPIKSKPPSPPGPGRSERIGSGRRLQRIQPEGKSGSRDRRRRKDTQRKVGRNPGAPVSRADGSMLDAAFVAALDRQDAERIRGGHVLSIVEGDSKATLADWATWAAGCGYLTLVTEGTSLDAAISELLAQTPWLRCLAEARRRLADAVGVDVDAIDAELEARSGDQRRAWVDEVAGFDPRVRVSGWLLSVTREVRASVPDLSTAPAQGGALLSILCELATPIAVLVHHAAPTAAWLERAISTAAGMMPYLPGRSIAVGAPRALVARVLGGDRQSAALSMARQGLVHVAARASQPPTRAPGRHARLLHDALSHDPRTARLFALNVQVPIPDGGPDVAAELAARGARLTVAIDGWYHGSDLQGYRRGRGEDERLRRAGYFVMRFAAEDIDHRLALVVNELAISLGARRAAADFSGEFP